MVEEKHESNAFFNEKEPKSLPSLHLKGFIWGYLEEHINKH